MVAFLSQGIAILFTALATGSHTKQQQQQQERSPWSSSEWTITINVDNKLAFPIQLLVESDYCSERDSEREFMGKGSLRLTVLNEPTYVTNDGMETVRMKREGGWKISLPKEKGHAGILRFWLDLEGQQQQQQYAAMRNDVTLPSGRLYFLANCWREEDLRIGYEKMRPIAQAAKESQQRIDEQLSHETGDRRLDGVNPIDTALAYTDMAFLVKNRDDKVRELRMAESYLPPMDDSNNYRNHQLPLGFWPGSTETLAIAPGNIAKMERKFLFAEEFTYVGRWKATPVLLKEETTTTTTTATKIV